MTSLCIFSKFLYAGTTRVSKKNAGIHSLNQLRKHQHLLLRLELYRPLEIIYNIINIKSLFCFIICYVRIIFVQKHLFIQIIRNNRMDDYYSIFWEGILKMLICSSLEEFIS